MCDRAVRRRGGEPGRAADDEKNGQERRPTDPLAQEERADRQQYDQAEPEPGLDDAERGDPQRFHLQRPAERSDEAGGKPERAPRQPAEQGYPKRMLCGDTACDDGLAGDLEGVERGRGSRTGQAEEDRAHEQQ